VLYFFKISKCRIGSYALYRDRKCFICLFYFTKANTVHKTDFVVMFCVTRSRVRVYLFDFYISRMKCCNSLAELGVRFAISDKVFFSFDYLS